MTKDIFKSIMNDLLMYMREYDIYIVDANIRVITLAGSFETSIDSIIYNDYSVQFMTVFDNSICELHTMPYSSIIDIVLFD